MLVKPHLLRDVQSEFDAFNMEEASVRRKLAATQDDPLKTIIPGNGVSESFITVVNLSTSSSSNGATSKLRNRVHLQEHKYESCVLHERLREIEADKNELGKVPCEWP